MTVILISRNISETNKVDEVVRCDRASNCSIVGGMYSKEVDAIVSENEPESIEGCNKINNLRLKEYVVHASPVISCYAHLTFANTRNLAPLTVVLKKSNRKISSTELRQWLHMNKAKL